MDQKEEVGTEAVPSNGKYKLHIGIPTYGKPDALFALDSVSALTYQIGRRHPEIETVTMQRDVRTYRQEARQAIVLGAQSAGATHLLMLDDDHTFGGTEFTKIWEAMRDTPDVDMLSALYFTRGEQCAPCIFKLTSAGTVPLFYYPKDQLYKVDVVGFGFVLFNMELFKTVTPPWFTLSIGYGEDAAFCARMIQAGKGVWVHTGVKIGHILETPRVIDEAHYERNRQLLETGQVVPSELAGNPQGVFVGGRPTLDTYESHPAKRPWWRPDFTHVWNQVSSLGKQEGS